MQLGLGFWFLIRPFNYDGGPGEGYLVQAFDESDAVRELGMGPVESIERDQVHGPNTEQPSRVNT